MGLFSPFFICGEAMALYELQDSILTEMGYELIEVEQSAPGKLLRIFVDKRDSGITIDDCVAISNHLNRLLTVEGIDYSRLEISSPGLDRPLKKENDFIRFAGKLIKIKLRIALQGQKNFIGTILKINDGMLELEVEGRVLHIKLDNLEKARLVPEI